MQLLQQFYKPTGGKILLDGQPIDRFDSEGLRQKIGVVNQEPVIIRFW
jgi:ABC-type multidrug transport system fused ATPase/permease subunit